MQTVAIKQVARSVPGAAVMCCGRVKTAKCDCRLRKLVQSNTSAGQAKCERGHIAAHINQ
jgi:RNase P/RNase MRP subunit POP5